MLVPTLLPPNCFSTIKSTSILWVPAGRSVSPSLSYQAYCLFYRLGKLGDSVRCVKQVYRQPWKLNSKTEESNQPLVGSNWASWQIRELLIGEVLQDTTSMPSISRKALSKF